ncbi:MAG: hypothetical protein U0K57_08375 [Lachnospiraceae bacterium]|nr:hypothetical protein [Lachnospiraceae bacterium]
MELMLEQISQITHGVVLNRIKPKLPSDGVEYPILSISQLLDEEDGVTDIDVPTVMVDRKKIKNLNIAHKESVVIGLTSFHRAAVLGSQHEGKIIPSNFVSIEFNNGIMDPYYFAWYFNEHPELSEQRRIAIQGNSSVKVLSIHMIRQLVIECPDLSTQLSIGKLYHCQKRKKLLLMEKLRLEEEVMTEEMMQYIKKL